MDAFFNQKKAWSKEYFGSRNIGYFKKNKKKTEGKVNQNEFSTVLTKTSFKSLGFLILSHFTPANWNAGKLTWFNMVQSPDQMELLPLMRL